MSLKAYWINHVVRRSTSQWFEHKSKLRAVTGIDGIGYFLCPVPHCHARLLTKQFDGKSLLTARCVREHDVVIDVLK